MGLANLVPGISGGTMLLAAGVYPGFISSHRRGDHPALPHRAAWCCWQTIVGSAALGILLLAGTVKSVWSSITAG